MYSALAGRDLLSIADLTRADIEAILDAAARAKSGSSLGRPLEGRCIAMIFQRPSNRTRVSFEVAIRRLGGDPIPIFGQEIQIGERESVADVSRILDRYVDGIVARLISHRDLVRMAGSAAAPVVSGMTDEEHPCQVLADLLTVRELTGAVEGARVAYVGDGNNVCASWLYAAALCDVDFRIICPPGYEPSEHVLERARGLRGPGARFRLDHEPAASLEDAQVIYTDVWTSMGQEAEQQRRREDFASLQVNDALVAMAPPSVRVMHCLPAHRGEEITDSVLDGPHSAVFDQAENRMWVQLGLLALIHGGGGRMSTVVHDAHIFLGEVSWRDLIDVLIVAYVLYQLMKIIRGTQAVQLLVGLVLLLLVGFFAGELHLRLLEWVFANGSQAIVIAAVILFQPELRRALDQLGRVSPVRALVGHTGNEAIVRLVEEVIRAAGTLSERRTGALIVFERETGLENVAVTGVRINGDVTAEMLVTIFFPNSPLHDGAAIIRQGKLVAAGCVLPLADAIPGVGRMGTRHRAALGLTLQSDAVVLIVSEETGLVSIADQGKIYRGLDPTKLRDMLIQLLGGTPPTGRVFIPRPFLRSGVRALTRR